MRALSEFIKSRGHDVTGSDRDISGHSPHNVEGCDLVVYTNAVGSDNCELIRARELGIPAVERATYLGELSKTYGNVIAVCGCHGKSTTAAMLGSVFGKRNPTVHVGVAHGSHVGGSDLFITEACEYRESFLHLSPDIGVVLNVGYDHPDYYRDEAALVRAYGKFCENCKTVISNGDDPIARTLGKPHATFGLGKDCDYRAVDIQNDCGYRTFRFVGKNAETRVRLSVPGEHNVYNALAALAVADVWGLKRNEAAMGLKNFSGIPRRFERKGAIFGKNVFVDYAHHPAEIAATLRTAHEIFPSVAVVFQPHTYSRTQSLMHEFADALSAADTVILAPVYSAREAPIDGITSHALCREIIRKNERAYCFDTFSEIVDFCKTANEKALIFMGAGNIDIAARNFLSLRRD